MLAEQMNYSAWRRDAFLRHALPFDLVEFRRTGPTDYPEAWEAWVVYHATQKLLEQQ